MDLLMDSKRTIEVNDNISMPYIGYQILLMGGTILGPGTIFLMLVGAFVAAFQIDNWTSFCYNIYPIFFFMLVCFTCKSNIQVSLILFLISFYNYFTFTANHRSDSIHWLCVNHDGCNSGYRPAITRRRCRFTVRHFLDSHDGILRDSSISPSSRVLVHRSRIDLFAFHSIYVLVIDLVFNY